MEIKIGDFVKFTDSGILYLGESYKFKKNISYEVTNISNNYITSLDNKTCCLISSRFKITQKHKLIQDYEIY